tara:strand:- start:6065 stop:7453 length:1389 start_codon:yes stop_codon:yes gene_type:complete
MENQIVICHNGDELPVSKCEWIECLSSYYPQPKYCREGEPIPIYCGHQDEWFISGEMYGCLDLDPTINQGIEISHQDYCVEAQHYYDDWVWMLEYIHDDNGAWCQDERWVSSGHLNDAGYYWNERADDYVHEDDDSYDDADNMRDYNNKFDVKSTTFLATSSMKYTFGLEFETNSMGYLDEYFVTRDNLSLAAIDDGSISGKEYVTGVLAGDKGVDMLARICESLNGSDCRVNSSCGLHVHIGGFQDNRRFSMLALRLGKILEPQLFKMLPPSRQNSTFCKKIPYDLDSLVLSNTNRILAEYVFDAEALDKYNNKGTHTERYTSQRYRWLNLVNCNSNTRYTTIEFRQHSGTLSFNKAYNWMLICMSFVNFVENQPRRIMRGNVTLQEIVRYSVKGELGDNVIKYIKSRYEKFGNDFVLESPSFHNLSRRRIENINEFLKQLNDEEKQRQVFRATDRKVLSA